jgi:hypothetical protein
LETVSRRENSPTEMGENPHHKAASQFLVNSRETCPSPQPFSEQPSGLPQNKDKPRNGRKDG